MMLEILVLLAVCFTPTTGIHCEDDKALDDVQEYSEEVQNIGDLEYWRTAQNNFQVYGKFDGDPSTSVISAGYYTADNLLIHGLTIDCGNKKWSSQITDRGTDVVKNWLTGDLATECESGAVFDIWLKIHQPFMMSWIFNAQPLQFETRITEFRHGMAVVERIRTLEVPTKYGSNKAKFFKIKASGAAKFTRITWGQCITWPMWMENNCQGARQWVQARSKMATTVEPLPGLGHFGSDWQIFAPSCFMGSKYYDWLQESVHPDRNSRGRSYCCCVDMVSGHTIDDNDEAYCGLSTDEGGCDRSCMQHVRNDLIEEVMAEQDEMEQSLLL